MTIDKNQRALAQLSAIYRPGTLNLIGGRPGMGKTTLAFQLATETRQSTAYFSLKMKCEQLLLRHSTGQCPKWIHIDDTATLTVDSIREKVRQLRETYDIRWVIIDYLQLMTSSQPYPNREDEIIHIIQELKKMAVEQHVTVIALTQLLRTVLMHDDYRPTLQDMPNWERIGEWVDDVRLLHRDEYYHIVGGKKNLLEVLTTECGQSGVPDLQLKYLKWDASLTLKQNIHGISDTDKLRAMLATTEEEILRVAKPFDGDLDWDTPTEKVLDQMLEERACILNRMFELHCTEAEVRRFEHVNEALLKMTNRFHEEQQQLNRQLDMLPDIGEHSVNRFHLTGEINYCHDYEDPKLFPMEEDAFYGSHWNEMLWAVSSLPRMDAHTIHNGESNHLDDGQTWAEGPLRIPQFEHICVCYLVHALCTHLRYSIPDLLRMTTYSCERSMWEMSEADVD
ncbi:MAG: AAA family ATPase [Bacteroidales bacterium]|nr:AAA family ATPase [Bacteroidales bacterium]